MFALYIAGIYHDLWGTSGCVRITLTKVKELQTVTEHNGTLLCGAGVTLSALIQWLKHKAEHSSNCSIKHSLQQMVNHMSRIAGTLVRNAATLGGNLVLARNRCLESDLVPILMAAGRLSRCTATSLVLTDGILCTFLTCLGQAYGVLNCVHGWQTCYVAIKHIVAKTVLADE